MSFGICTLPSGSIFNLSAIVPPLGLVKNLNLPSSLFVVSSPVLNAINATGVLFQCASSSKIVLTAPPLFVLATMSIRFVVPCSLRPSPSELQLICVPVEVVSNFLLLS